MTQLTRTQLRQTVERYFDAVAAGSRIDAEWKQRMIDISTPELPPRPTPLQIDAWNEITAMLDDQSFIAEVRAETNDMWRGDFDPAAYAAASDATLARVRETITRGELPTSQTGIDIAREWLHASASSMKRSSRSSTPSRSVSTRSRSEGVPYESTSPLSRRVGAAAR